MKTGHFPQLQCATIDILSRSVHCMLLLSVVVESPRSNIMLEELLQKCCSQHSQYFYFLDDGLRRMISEGLRQATIVTCEPGNTL